MGNVKEIEPFNIDEIIQLIKYASDNGVGEDITGELNDSVNQYRREKKEEGSNNLPSAQATIPPEQNILKLYTQLCLKTLPVNGKTLIDTQTKATRNSIKLIIWTATLFVLVSINEIFEIYFRETNIPDSGAWFWLSEFQRYVLDFLSPFFWGALGSCIYLLKTINDKISTNTFDASKLPGWGARVWLGAILGAIIMYLYDTEGFTSKELNLDANAVAFLVGMGVKVVYGAIEKTVESFSEKLGLEALRKTPAVSDGAGLKTGKDEGNAK